MTLFVIDGKRLTDCERVRELIDLERPMPGEVYLELIQDQLTRAVDRWWIDIAQKETL